MPHAATSARTAASAFKLPVLRRVASGLRDQGDFVRAVDAYRAVLADAPADSGALASQREIVDIYQNRVLEPDKAQAARLELVDRFAPNSVWWNANEPLRDTALAAREVALRQSAQYSLSRAQDKKDRAKFAEAADLYARYMGEYSKSDSAQAVDLLYGEALFAEGEYFKAGTEYSRAAYAYTKDPKLSAQAGQDAIVAFDSATVRTKGDRAAQDSLFAVVDKYAAAFPQTDVAHHALIEKGKRASEAQRWDVMAATFKTYAENYPTDPYTPTAQKLIGDALYKQGLYTEAQGQWENAQAIATKSGRRALADSITLVRNAAAVTYGDSLVKAGNYREAAEAVYVAFADRNPTSDRAPDALRNAIETYVLADSVARTKNDASASSAAKQRALELSQRLVTSYPTYKYRVQYQALQTQLLADLGKRNESRGCARDPHSRESDVAGSRGRNGAPRGRLRFARQAEGRGGGVRAVRDRVSQGCACRGRTVQRGRRIPPGRGYRECDSRVRHLRHAISARQPGGRCAGHARSAHQGGWQRGRGERRARAAVRAAHDRAARGVRIARW